MRRAVQYPKNLWRIKTDVNVVPVPPPVRKIDSKGTAVLNAQRVPAIAANPRDGPNMNSEIGTTRLSRARARNSAPAYGALVRRDHGRLLVEAFQEPVRPVRRDVPGRAESCVTFG